MEGGANMKTQKIVARGWTCVGCAGCTACWASATAISHVSAANIFG